MKIEYTVKKDGHECLVVIIGNSRGQLISKTKYWLCHAHGLGHPLQVEYPVLRE